MEEIKVGEYCRTEYGICKLENYRESGALYFDKLHEDLWSGDFQGVLYPCDIEDTIIKHSLNIIDVLEIGDIATMKYRHLEVIKPLDETDIAGLKSGELKLVSVVTHESFNSIKYEVI